MFRGNEGRAGRRSATGSAALLLSALLAAGCGGGVSVHVGNGDTISTAHYRKVWARDWKVINAASEAWNASDSKPGACDKGGEKVRCYETDRAVLVGLKQLIADLEKEPTPVSYTNANRALLVALAKEVQGLDDRSLSLRPPVDDDRFRKGISELQQAATDLVAAYTKFPDGDRPVPALFGQGRHSG